MGLSRVSFLFRPFLSSRSDWAPIHTSTKMTCTLCLHNVYVYRGGGVGHENMIAFRKLLNPTILSFLNCDINNFRIAICLLPGGGGFAVEKLSGNLDSLIDVCMKGFACEFLFLPLSTD